MKKKITYIGFFDINRLENRSTSMACVNIMRYVSSVIGDLGYLVNIVSPAMTNNKRVFYKKRKEIICQNVCAIIAPTFRGKSKLSTACMVIYAQLWLFFYLIFHVKKEEQILVYHSMSYLYPLIWAKKLKGFKLIYQVAEIYQDVMRYPKSLCRAEYTAIDAADNYIFMSELLNSKLNKYNKPFCILNGTYALDKELGESWNDGRIHLVYSGIIDTIKGGAFNACAAAEFLTPEYHTHIIGFGAPEDIYLLQKKIECINNKNAGTVSYDGIKDGEEFVHFLQKCDIGYATQNPELSYNETSFPSKILSYLSNGLKVVSVEIEAVVQSEISKILYFYKKNDPLEIAKAVLSVDFKKEYDSRVVIQNLHRDFLESMRKMLKK